MRFSWYARFLAMELAKTKNKIFVKYKSAIALLAEVAFVTIELFAKEISSTPAS